MGKSKETAGSEVETVVGMEGGVDTKVGTDSESTVDMSRTISGAVDAEASMGSAIATTGGDAEADMQSMVAGMDTRDDAVAVAWTEVHTIAETILSACAVAVNAQL